MCIILCQYHPNLGQNLTTSVFHRLAATALEVIIEALSTDALSSVRADNFRFPEGVLNITADWLIMQQDRTSGIFRETGTVHNRLYLVRFYSGTTNEIIYSVYSLSLNVTSTMMTVVYPQSLCG